MAIEDKSQTQGASPPAPPKAEVDAARRLSGSQEGRGSTPSGPKRFSPAPPVTHPTPSPLPLECLRPRGMTVLERSRLLIVLSPHLSRQERTSGRVPCRNSHFTNRRQPGVHSRRAKLVGCVSDPGLPGRRHSRGSQRGVEGAWGRRGVPLGAVWGAPCLAPRRHTAAQRPIPNGGCGRVLPPASAPFVFNGFFNARESLTTLV